MAFNASGLVNSFFVFGSGEFLKLKRYTIFNIIVNSTEIHENLIKISSKSHPIRFSTEIHEKSR